MKGEKGHDELVEEVIKRLAENDLYVKLEKYKWKVKEVGFLKVVIRPESIKMKEEKVKRALVSRLLTMDLIFIFISYFIFHFLFFSYFSIFRTTWVRGYQSRCHISHKLMV